MKLNKVLLSLAMTMSLATGMIGTTSVNAIDGYISDDDLSDTQTDAPKAWGVTPTNEQYRYQKEELAGFVHFGPNTFNEIEWGENYGDQTPDEIFRLEKDFDAETLVKAFKDAGFKKIIVTAKHHDGFCIWNSQYTDYDVASTSYKNGDGDILAEISEECSKYDIDMGLYLSPWDIHAPSYGYYDENGNPTTADKDVLDYNDYYVNQLNEILGNDKYGNNGHFTEIWMDGAKGSGANAQEYDFKRWYNTIQSQEGEEAGFDSECMIFQCGANTTVRWIGNENGYAAKDTWSKSNVNVEADTCDDNKQGSYTVGYENGNKWTVPEADARITSGWFWGTKKNTPKSITDLGNMYFNSVGHNAPLLLNVPPNTDGTVDDQILERLAEFGQNINETFDENLAAGADVKIGASSVRGNDITYKPGNVIDGDDSTYWTVDDQGQSGTLLIDLGSTKSFDVVSIEEAIQFGQSINEYKVEYRNGDDGQWKTMDEGKTIGAKRLVRTGTVKADQIRITVDTNKTDALPIISEVGVYKTSDAFELAGSAPDGMDVIDIEDTNINDGAGFAFSGTWNKESGTNFINGTNRYAYTGSSLTLTFTGSKVYLLGTKDPNHGNATITIDDGTPINIDTSASSRATGQMLFASDDLTDGKHTLKLEITSKAVGIEAAYAINNGGKGMIGLEASEYTMNEDERMNVKIVRVGGTKGTISAKLQPNPGTAIQDDFNTELISNIVMEDGVKEVTAPVETRRNTNATGDRMFSIELTDPSTDLILGFNDKANITIRDTETSFLKELNELIKSVEHKQKGWYISGWEDFEQALAYAIETANTQNVSVTQIKQAITDLNNAVNGLVEREKYTKEDPFIFPKQIGDVSSLEAEFASEIVNDPSNDNGWPCIVTEGSWASNGKFVDAILQGDVVKYNYDVETAGTYHVKAYYRSGSNANKLSWSEENGKIESGEVSAGASSTAETHIAEFDLNVLEAGEGVLVFTGPEGKSPQLDKLEIECIELQVDKTALNEKIKEADSLNEANYTADTWKVLQEALTNAKTIAAKEDASQEEIDNAYNALTNAIDNLKPVVTDVDKTALKIAIDLANAITDEDLEKVIPAVANEFIAARDEANAVYNNASATQEEVNNAFDRLAEAMHMLEFVKGDKTALKAFIDKVTGLDSSKYTETTWTAFDKELTEANAVYNDENAMQEEVNNAYSELVTAFLNLRLKADKSALQAFVDYVSDVDSSKYTETTWKMFEAKLNEANVVLKDENATQEQVDSAYNELVKAYLDLRLKPNKDLLEDLINQANGLNVANYTKASFEGLTKALNEAKVVFENPNATQKEVDSAKATLEKAINSLEANTPVDNTTNIPVSNGDTTSVKTGDESLTGMFATIALLSVAGCVVLRRKED
ncbi:alpha-L-fucosidase [Thomasclavelia spiroformis]|uniref:alpha-L-fucosidase n=1 Tax=Thomasclavelia spiroformis TaxID=29348 RepID=UPI0026745A9E|nr:alpha-L-fucosidase [Thomasclavelia spiroformis]